MNKTSNLEIMAILRKPTTDWTLDESVTVAVNLEPTQMMTPQHTLFVMMVQELVDQKWGLDIARTIVSIELLGNSEAWRLA